MRLPTASIVSAIAGLALACSVTTDLDGYSRGSATDPAGDDDGDVTGASASSAGSDKTPTTSSSSGSSATSSASSASSSSGGGGGDDDAILVETFAGGCGAWTLVGSATVTPLPETHGDGGGSCMMCATATGDVLLERTVDAPRSGKASLTMFARRQSPNGPSSATVTVRSGGSNISLSKGVDDTFTAIAFGGSGASVPAGAAVTASIGMKQPAAGDCLIVDDVVLTVK